MKRVLRLIRMATRIIPTSCRAKTFGFCSTNSYNYQHNTCSPNFRTFLTKGTSSNEDFKKKVPKSHKGYTTMSLRNHLATLNCRQNGHSYCQGRDSQRSYCPTGRKTSLGTNSKTFRDDEYVEVGFYNHK